MGGEAADTLQRLRSRVAARSRVRRAVRLTAAAAAASPARARGLPDRYFIKGGYRHRPRPAEFVPEEDGIVWQPDVYADAARVATASGARRIVDVGCGDGVKLAELHPEFAVVGLDVEPMVEACRTRFPFGSWVEHDLETEGPLPLDEDELAGSVVVSADVIEHLVRPERLLRKLRRALDAGAHAVLVSTPERDLTWGPGHDGPPPNPCHVREWTLAELSAFLASEGFHGGRVGLTRSNDREPHRNTILAVLDAG